MYSTNNNLEPSSYDYTSYVNQVKEALNSDLNVGSPGHNWRAFGDELGMTTRELNSFELQARGNRFSPNYVQYTSFVIDHYLEAHPRLKVEEIKDIFARALQKCRRDDLYRKLLTIPLVQDSKASVVSATRQPQQTAQTSSPYVDGIKKTLNPALNVGVYGRNWRTFGGELGMTTRELDNIELQACGDHFSPNYVQFTSFVIDHYLKSHPNLEESKIRDTFAQALRRCGRDDLYRQLMPTASESPSALKPPSASELPASSFAAVYPRPSQIEQTLSSKTFTTTHSVEIPAVIPPSQFHVAAASVTTSAAQNPVEVLQKVGTEEKGMPNGYIRDILKRDSDYRIFASLNMDNKWKNVAQELGYTQQNIAMFEFQSKTQNNNFMGYMLCDLQPRNRATVDVLHYALLKSGYPDVAQDFIKRVKEVKGSYTPHPIVQELIDHAPQSAQGPAKAPQDVQNDAKISQTILKLDPVLKQSLEGNRDNGFVRDLVTRYSDYKIFHSLNSGEGWRQVAELLDINRQGQDYAYLAATSGAFPDSDYMKHVLDRWTPSNRATVSLLYHVLQQMDKQTGTVMAVNFKNLYEQRKGRLFIEHKL